MMFDVDDEHICSEEGLLGCSDDDDLNDDDDIYYDEVSVMMIYIMMKCLCVCLCDTENDHFLSIRAERRRREVSCPLGLAGCMPALAK